MRKIINMILIGTVASSCVTLNGDLVVNKEIQAKSKVGLFNLFSEKVSLLPGTYSADLKAKDQSSVMINLYFPETNELTIHIPISTSEETLNIPENGEFNILGDTIDQPFDVQGTIKTTFSNSYKLKMYEDCAITNNSKFVRTGKRSLDLYYRRTYREVTLALLEQDSASILANLNTSGTESEQITDNYSSCI